jgi:hypothetical protein
MKFNMAYQRKRLRNCTLRSWRHYRSAGRRPRQQEIGTPRFGRPTSDWDLIRGELATFTDPQRDLPPIVRSEGFRPGGHSMCQRVMVAVLCGRTSILAWTYWMPPC